MVPPPIGVFDLNVDAGSRFACREGCDGTGAFAGFAVGANAFGVFERGGGTFAAASSMRSRYLSPNTMNGLPYSSSHASRTFVSSASTFGKSFAMRLRIFSSRRSLVGSRLSPFAPFINNLEASWLEAARSSRSLIKERCFSMSCSVGARCSLSASSLDISASWADRSASLYTSARDQLPSPLISIPNLPQNMGVNSTASSSEK